MPVSSAAPSTTCNPRSRPRSPLPGSEAAPRRWDDAMWSDTVPTQANPARLVKVADVSKRQRQPYPLTMSAFQTFIKQLEEPFRTIACVCVCSVNLGEAISGYLHHGVQPSPVGFLAGGKIVCQCGPDRTGRTWAQSHMCICVASTNGQRQLVWMGRSHEDHAEQLPACFLTRTQAQRPFDN